jgi:hypothetical protein
MIGQATPRARRLSKLNPDIFNVSIDMGGSMHGKVTLASLCSIPDLEIKD